MARIKVAKVQTSAKKQSKRELYATVCYYYPQYKLEDAQSLPARDIILLINTAKRREAAYLYNLTAIAAAPHSKKMSEVKKLLNHFGNLAKG